MSPKKQSTAARKARTAARQGAKYTESLRTVSGATGPTDFCGGHEFEYESGTDLFRCTECRVYKVAAQDADGPITPCPGMEGYGGDADRVYLLVAENPDLHQGYGTSLATIIRSTGIGRTPQFSRRNGKLLVESAPSVVAELASRIKLTTFTVNGRQIPAAVSVEHLSAEAGRAILAENYAAYVAEYGEPS